MKKRILKGLRRKAAALALVSGAICGSAGIVSADDSYEEIKKAELINTLSEKEQSGDINGDGIINVFDVMRYKNSIVEGKEFESAERIDANSDGTVNGKDVNAVKNDILKQAKLWSYNSVPKMDGSTSAIPLEAGLKSKLLGISYYDAKLLVSHHKTHESFQMLLSGGNDMIFTVPISEDQKKAAEEAGVKLNFVPVAKEGFVFVVNKNNPVDSLTSAQIRDIYSGKITNWKEVGGNDENIIPYQRNKDSGSQNYMTEFMEGYNLMDPPKTYILGSMSSLMDGLAVYDNAENAIGYSVYSYAAQMYENSSDTKFVAVDGVKPTRETMADGTYPLLSSTSIVYTDKASQNTKDFAAWAVSDEGQKTVLSCGYVPVNDMEYPEELKPYYAKGTGKEKAADYKPSEKYSKYSIYNCSIDNYLIEYTLTNGGDVITFLKDKDLQKAINDDIEKVILNEATLLNGEWSMNVEIFNGYMNVTLRRYQDYIGDFNKFLYLSDQEIELNYDLINRKKIEKFSDLFYKDADFVPLVSQTVGKFISIYCPDYLKTDYIGLLGDVSQFSFDSVIPAAFGTYFDKYVAVPFQDNNAYEMIDNMVIGEYFDCSEVLEVNCEDSYYSEWMEGYVSDVDGKLHYNFTSRFHTEDEVAAKNQIMEKCFEKTKVLYEAEYPESDELNANQVIVRFSADTLSNYEEINAVIAYAGRSVDGKVPVYMFDPETLEQIKKSDIFGEEFEKYDGSRYIIESTDIFGKTVKLYDLVKDRYYSERINPEELNMKYIMTK